MTHNVNYIPHRILAINSRLTNESLDPVIMEGMRLIFEWSNKMGLSGQRVYDLFIDNTSFKSDPMNQQTFIWCRKECSDEERKKWDELQQINYESYLFDSINGK